MDLSQKILSDITVFSKYAKFQPDKQRRETWSEIVDRNKQMHLRKFPQLEEKINWAYKFVEERKILPSMRSMQFGGQPIEVNNARLYNCSFLPIDDLKSFSETMFLLLCGTGVGFSVQNHHIDKLPEIRRPKKESKRYLIGDSIEGWADAVKALMKSYFRGSETIKFDYSSIRPKGSLIKTSGGKAPGPQPLKECLVKIEGILSNKETGERLRSIEVYDIINHIADAVLAGGVRRAALICLFSATDEEMISSKSGSWWELNPQRGRSNNSVVLLRDRVTKDFFDKLWQRVKDSQAGEPGFFFSNDKDWGTNPCCEVSLRPFQFCNLVEVNSSNIESLTDLKERVTAATIIATLQASYTDFHYLRSVWKKITEKDALIGVSMTGIASMEVFKYDIEFISDIVKTVNESLAEQIGINKSARCTVVKPAGTTSLVLGTSSGIHAWHDKYYIRRMRLNKTESLYTYLSIYHPELVKDEIFRPHDTAVVEIPQKAPSSAVTREETAFDLLERVKLVSQKWISNGHRSGSNRNNVSATISIRENEWNGVREWMWENRNDYTGLSILPFDGGTYTQAPFETITEEKYRELVSSLTDIDLSKVIEMSDQTSLKEELACQGNNCEIS